MWLEEELVSENYLFVQREKRKNRKTIRLKLSVVHFFYGLGCLASGSVFLLSERVLKQEILYEWSLRINAICVFICGFCTMFLRTVSVQGDIDMLDVDEIVRTGIEGQASNRNRRGHSRRSSVLLIKKILGIGIEKSGSEEDLFLLNYSQQIESNYNLSKKYHHRTVRKAINATYYVLLWVCTFFYVGMEVTFGGWIFTYSFLEKQYDINFSFLLCFCFWAGFCFGRLVDLILCHFILLRPHLFLLLSSFLLVAEHSILISFSLPRMMFILLLLAIGFCMSFIHHNASLLHIMRFNFAFNPQNLLKESMKKIALSASGSLGAIALPVFVGFNLDKQQLGGWKIIFWTGGVSFTVVFFVLLLLCVLDYLYARYKSKLLKIAVSLCASPKQHY